ncbi:hypothetical protein [Latilactobacillus sakei]
MSKYSFELKKTIVSEYLTNTTSFRKLEKKYDIERSIIRSWIYRVNLHGIESLLPNSAKPIYNQQQKIDIIEYKILNNLSFHTTAARFEIVPSSVYQWQKKFDDGEFDTLNSQEDRSTKKMKKTNGSPKNKEEIYRQEIIKLKQELHLTRMELAVSKKLEALAILNKQKKI